MRNSIAPVVLSLTIASFIVEQSRMELHVPAPDKNLIAKTSDARTILDRAKAAARNIKSDFKRQFVLNEIGAAQAKNGELDEAVDTANIAFPFADLTLESIGAQLAATNDLTRAKSLGLRLNNGRVSSLLSFMARNQAKTGNIDEALRTARQIRFSEVRSYALEDIAQQQVVRRDYSGARSTLALARVAHPKGFVSAKDLEMMIVMSRLSEGFSQAARASIDSWNPAEDRYAALMGGAEEFLQKGDKDLAAAWLQDALRTVPAGQENDFSRYFAIPLQVKLGQNERAMQAAGTFSPELRVKGYSAVAVTCAEIKDGACVNVAIEKMQSGTSSENERDKPSDFGVKMMVLNVTAALIDNSQFGEASRLLTKYEQNPSETSEMFILPIVHLQRVFILAQQGSFEEARSLALKIRVGSVDEVQRGNALRITALLETRKKGAASTQRWASELAGHEDRAYALLGIAQALLEIDNVKLHYSAIQIH